MIKKFLIKHNIIKGTFAYDPFIYVSENTGHPISSFSSEISDRIKWLEPIVITCKHRDADYIAFTMAHYKYPEYVGCINLF